MGWSWEQLIATLICPQAISLAGTVTISISTKKYRIEHNIVTSLFVLKVWSTNESKDRCSSVTHAWTDNHIAFVDNYVFLFIMCNNRIHYHMRFVLVAVMFIYIATVSRAGTMTTSNRKYTVERLNNGHSFSMSRVLAS